MATAQLPAPYHATPGEIGAYDPQAGMRRKLRNTFVALGVLVVLFVTAFVLVPIGGAVVAQGAVGVESRVKRIAHPTGGIVTEIYVENGDRVTKGDILMRLDDTVSGADAQLSTLTVDQMLAQRARLEAERLGASAILFPPELIRSRDPGARRAMADERKLFGLRRSESGGIASQLTARIDQYQQQIGGYQAQIVALQKQQALIKPEREGVRELWEKDLVTISRLNQLERTAADVEGGIASLRAQIAEAQARITEAREQMIQVGQTRRSEAGTELASVNATLNQQQVRSVSAGDTQERSIIRAPYDGTVDKMIFNTIGDVVKAAETIMEIVPANDDLVIEAAVSPADIDRVRDGQEARLRFSAFSAGTTPEFTGWVDYVAPERTTDERAGTSYYAVRVALAERLPQDIELALRPGMPAEVFIETGSRSMLSYITKPLRDQFARAFRDDA